MSYSELVDSIVKRILQVPEEVRVEALGEIIDDEYSDSSSDLYLDVLWKLGLYEVEDHSGDYPHNK